jgi:sec-independent protein translocase protein TatA
MFRALEPWHFIILVLLVVLLFGGRRLPDAARGLGRSLRIFKSEMKQMQDDSPRPAGRTTDPVERPVEGPIERPIEGPVEGPYEGRVVNGRQQRAASPGESSRDA